MTEHIGHIMKLISDRMRGNADADLKKHNLTLPQARVLKFISRNGGSVTQRSIEEHLGVSHPTVVGIVSRMAKNGFLEFYIDKADKRNKIVKLTPLAAALDKQLRNSIDERETKMLSGLTNEEITQLRAMLTVMYNNLNQG